MNKERSTEEQRLSFEAARGDVGAFSLLISRYTSSLRHFVSGYCSNSCDIEDICQETLRKAFMAISTFNPEMKFKNWLFEIAKNSALDNARRKKNALKTVDINDMSDESLESNDTSYISPEEKLRGTTKKPKKSLLQIWKKNQIQKLQFTNMMILEN